MIKFFVKDRSLVSKIVLFFKESSNVILLPALALAIAQVRDPGSSEFEFVVVTKLGSGGRRKRSRPAIPTVTARRSIIVARPAVTRLWRVTPARRNDISRPLR